MLADLDIAAKDVTEQISQELAAANIKLPDMKKRYPESPEQKQAANVWVATRAAPIREKFEEHLNPFVENPLQISYAFEYLSWRGREPVDEILGAAILPRLVSAFEQFIGALLRTGLTFHPEALGRTVTFHST